MDYSILIPDCINYYLDGFKKTEYPACFRHYCQQTEGIFQEISIPTRRRAPGNWWTGWMPIPAGFFGHGGWQTGRCCFCNTQPLPLCKWARKPLPTP